MVPTCSVNLSFQSLLQQPLVQVRRGVGAVPAIVADPQIFVVERPAASVPERFDHNARLPNHTPIGIALETPAGDILDLRSGLGVPAAADGYDGRPATWTCSA